MTQIRCIVTTSTVGIAHSSNFNIKKIKLQPPNARRKQRTPQPIDNSQTAIGYLKIPKLFLKAISWRLEVRS